MSHRTSVYYEIKMDRLLLQWVVLMISITTLCQACHPADFKGLTSFKSAISHDTSGRLAKWVGRNCCGWDGISCHNATGRVKEINLPGFISTGDIPFQSEMMGYLSSSITLLHAVEVIDLGGLIGLGGTIPKFIGLRLRNLRKLYLYGNKLRGPLPESIGKLMKLEELAVHDNRLSGSLPASLGSLMSLHFLHLDGNRFSGLIPDSITNLTKLVRMDLHSNSFVGWIPERIGELQMLNELDLSNNFLSGKIPISLTKLTALSVLYLDNNNLEGPLLFPPALAFLRLNGNRLSGTIPPSFGELVSLKRASLSNNKLEGTIPSSLGRLSALSELYLDRNRFSGELPESFGQLSQLILLDLSHNFIKGPLPEMSSLQNIQTIDLSFNRLSLTAIPQWLGKLPSLSKMYLAGCGIHGEIPEFLRRTPSPIQELDLSLNYLTGKIPEWIGSLTALYSLKLSQNSLVYEIPDSITKLQDLRVLDLHSNKLTGNIRQIFNIEHGFPDDSLTYIDLSDNNFSGEFDQVDVGQQPGIQFLNLSHNNLKGRLPISIGGLKSIQSLDLSSNNLGFDLPEAMVNANQLETLKLQRNHFTGKIPQGFLKLRKLKELDLSNNLLVGEIPAGKPLSDFPRSAYIGNRGLCGKPLNPCKV
ncbi:probable inactive leucine-rich repeat receptor kinase XIAO [Cucurbita moschata]|uniref:Probable inactive leucine-rich repeat receptor kinase XIAO n=1 Tax=Cucurbita moschata TaxID=3662 RepID=A0A6J1FUE5_CUCMO|nr:probable inactive leucine-rich repeat receptor kinase XIAO [Cucurbita moschata]